MGIHLPDKLYLIKDDSVVKIDRDYATGEGLHFWEECAVWQIHFRKADAQASQNERYGVLLILTNVRVIGKLIQ